MFNTVWHSIFKTRRSIQTGLKGLTGGLHFSFILLGASFLIAGTSGTKAQYFNALPTCGEASVHAKIVKRFNQADRILWLNGTRLKYIKYVSERSYNNYPDSQINRRYCRGKAYMSDGRTRRVHFLIEQHMGLAGFSWGVEYCLKGSDYWHAYGGWCRVLRKHR